MARHELHCRCGQTSVKLEFEAPAFEITLRCLKCNKMLFRQASPREASAGKQGDIHLQQKGGQNFGQYTVTRKLGEGGMAAVYLAVDSKTQEQVALKIFRQAEDNRSLKYITREAQILHKLKHPNIVSLKGWGNYQGYPYFAMEYVSGSNLEELIGNEPLQPRDALQIVLYVVKAVIYASQFQIVHRDIKPANILVSNDGIIKLIDMGISKIVEDSGALTKTGEIMGTAYYMPPEQLRDAKRADFRADIYAIGATLYHTLCGTPPFVEYGKQINKLIFAKISNKYISLEERNPYLPPQIYKIVKKAMEHRVEDRYGNLLEMEQEWLAVYQSLRS